MQNAPVEPSTKERLRLEKIENAQSLRKEKLAILEKMREEEHKKAVEFRLKEEWHRKMQMQLDAIAKKANIKEKRRREMLAKQQVSLDDLLA